MKRSSFVWQNSADIREHPQKEQEDLTSITEEQVSQQLEIPELPYVEQLDVVECEQLGPRELPTTATGSSSVLASIRADIVLPTTIPEQHQELPTTQAVSNTGSCGVQYSSGEQPIILVEDNPVNQLDIPGEDSPLELAAATGQQGQYENVEQKGLGVVDYAISEHEDGTEVANPINTLEVTCMVKGYETGNPPMHSNMHVNAEPSRGNVEQQEVGRKAHNDCDIEQKRRISHNQPIEKMKVTKRVWKDSGKGQGFGYVSSKVTKLYCNPKTRGSVNLMSTTVLSDSNSQEGGLVTFGNTEFLKRFSDFMSKEEARLLEKTDILSD